MASTYVNDLRLNEMATGDQSGSWGTVTNTNLELIAEAFSYGTEAITTNADTHTTTIADGATDPGRSMFLKYTGTLDSACTITIGPNTVSKLWFIENATSGSQNIIIKQGSGATVTIASGKTKVIYSDGVGSGAKMVDAFAALDVGALSGTSATFDGGVDIDNINIDGTTIALSSGNLTLDVAGELILDADTSGVVRLKDGGTEYGTLFTTSSNFLIKSQGNDKDIIFQGNDSGGSGFTALTLDMSNGGRANFNNDIGLIDNRGLKLGSGDDSVIYNDGSNTYIRNNTSNQDIIFQGNDDGSANTTALTLDMSDAGTAIFNHNIKLPDNGVLQFGAGSDLAMYSDGTNGVVNVNNGDLTLDVAGDINLDAGGTDIYLKTQGNSWGHFMTTSNNFYIASTISDGDIVFQGVDGGSGITALTLDMSDAGTATFNHDVLLGDNSELKLGSDGDLKLFCDGSGNYIRSQTSDMDLSLVVNDGGNIITALVFDSSAAGAATFNNAVTATTFNGDGSNLTGVGGSTDYGAVGTYIAAYRTHTNDTTTYVQPGQTFSGTGFRKVDGGGALQCDMDCAQTTANSQTNNQSGTWRAMSSARYNGVYNNTMMVPSALYVRIS